MTKIFLLTHLGTPGPDKIDTVRVGSYHITWWLWEAKIMAQNRNTERMCRLLTTDV